VSGLLASEDLVCNCYLNVSQVDMVHSLVLGWHSGGDDMDAPYCVREIILLVLVQLNAHH
jgi:hypothetical protein